MLKEIIFGSESLSYIREELSNGEEFAEHLLHLPLEDGLVLSYLPENISNRTRRSFRESIFLTSGLMIRDEVEAKIVKFITDYLNRHEGNYAVIETLARVGDPWVESAKISYFVYNSVVYIFLSHQHTGVEYIHAMLRHARDYPFICGLTSLPKQKISIATGQILVEETVQQLADGVDHILIGAYDAEGILIWSRRKPYNKVVK
jgi:hypothetical protein